MIQKYTEYKSQNDADENFRLDYDFSFLCYKVLVVLAIQNEDMYEIFTDIQQE